MATKKTSAPAVKKSTFYDAKKRTSIEFAVVDMDKAGKRFAHKGTTSDGRTLMRFISENEAKEFQALSPRKSLAKKPSTAAIKSVSKEKKAANTSQRPIAVAKKTISKSINTASKTGKEVQTGKKTPVASSKSKNLSTSKDLVTEKRQARTPQKEKLASDKAREILESQESSCTPAVQEVQNDPDRISSLKDVKVIMNEHSLLALQQLRGGLQELLRPLEKIEELRAMVEQLQADLQSLDSRVASLRQNLDDDLDQLKQCINHKAQPSKQ